MTQDLASLTFPSTYQTLERQAQALRNVQETVDLLTMKSAAILGRAAKLTIDENKVYADAYDALKKMDKDQRRTLKLKQLNERYRKELEEEFNDNNNNSDENKMKI